MNKELEQVIFSFSKYGLGDIKENKERPIAAFILAACLIKAISNYRYAYSSVSNKEEVFIEEYMPMYDAKKLYNSLYEQLIPFYSLINGHYKIGCGDRSKKENNEEGVIHIDDFITNFEIAVNNFLFQSKLYRSESVLKFYNEHPIIS